MAAKAELACSGFKQRGKRMSAELIEINCEKAVDYLTEWIADKLPLLENQVVFWV